MKINRIIEVEDIFIIQPENKEQANALKAFLKSLKMKFDIATEKTYNPEFVVKIKRSKLQHIRGEAKVIKTDDLWK